MNIAQILELRNRVLTDKEVGVEIEIEGGNLPSGDSVSEYWRREHDGSLRPSPDAAEYVFSKPLTQTDASKALVYLQKACADSGMEFNDSGRAGVHVHVNCQSMQLHQLANFMVIYLIMENMAVRYCGEDRVGNHFCLRVEDAEWLIMALTEAFCNRNLDILNTDELRYASMNVRSLFQYGSLEFRAMRTCEDFDAIDCWMSTLLKMRDAAMQFDDPGHIMYTLSAEGAENFCANILGEHVDKMVDMDCENEVMACVRRIQDLAYMPNWEDIKSPKKRIGGLELPIDFEDDFPPMDV